MNSVGHEAPPSVTYSLYIDDIQIFSSTSISRCERQLQITINKLAKWSSKNGFRFSLEKTVYVLFFSMRGRFLGPKIIGQDIAVWPAHELLGVIFDHKLTFMPHTKNLKAKPMKPINIPQNFVTQILGCRPRSSASFLHLHCSLLVWLCLCGLWVCAKVCPGHFGPHWRRRVVTAMGGFHTSPVPSRNVECNGWLLLEWRFFFASTYAMKARSYLQHPALACTTKTCFQHLLLYMASVIPPFSMQAL